MTRLERAVREALERYDRCGTPENRAELIGNVRAWAAVQPEIPVLLPHELESLRSMVDRMYELQGGVREVFDRLVTATHQVHRDHVGTYTVPAGSGERGPLTGSLAIIPSSSGSSHPSAPGSPRPQQGGGLERRPPASMNGHDAPDYSDCVACHACGAAVPLPGRA